MAPVPSLIETTDELLVRQKRFDGLTQLLVA